MRILVYEWACAGGYRSSPSILCEGYAMMSAVAEDFSKIAEVAVSLDPALAASSRGLKPAAASLREAIESFKPDYALIIAPESAGTLKSLVEETTDLGVSLLNCSPDAIELCGDKQRTLEEAERVGLAAPSSMVVSTLEAPQQLPWSKAVAKPIDGVGCDSLYLVGDRLELLKALRLMRSSGWHRAVIQEYVRGANLSVSLISHHSAPRAYTVNSQFVKLAAPPGLSSYMGGYTPIRIPEAKRAAEAAEKLCRSIRGLRGYVGVDMVLADEPYVIEVNPRLTTSYVGVRMVLGRNPAEIMLSEGEAALEVRGYSAFRKLQLRDKPKLRAYIAAPPGSRQAMVAVWAPTLREALAELKRVG